ncbi:hypothetical protein H5410_026146 [Solanum commersonii]|uniref:Uncharacterized protein n=1 Tax=Solanum commersonii TaxID=4109 RepID=A0A9J5Z0M8_SOLCO|nr:hypothetical protein H5410_026146 [Solanum commersonii]
MSTNAYITRVSSAINKPALVPKFTTHDEIVTNEIKCLKNLVELGINELTLLINDKGLVTMNRFLLKNNKSKVMRPHNSNRHGHNMEANSTTDLLAKHSHQQDIEQHYYTPNQLPHTVKESYLFEKMGAWGVAQPLNLSRAKK